MRIVVEDGIGKLDLRETVTRWKQIDAWARLVSKDMPTASDDVMKIPGVDWPTTVEARKAAEAAFAGIPGVTDKESDQDKE